jgi:hypothetical protein
MEMEIVNQTNKISKADILQKAKEYFNSIAGDRLETLTPKGFRKEFMEKFGDAYAISKEDIYEIFTDYQASIEKNKVSSNQNEQSGDDEIEDDDIEEVNTRNEFTKRFEELSEEWKSRYAELVWVKTNPSYPW